MPRGTGAIHWEITVGGCAHHLSSLARAPAVLRRYGIDVSASRVYNEVHDQSDAARGLPVPVRAERLAPRVSIRRVGEPQKNRLGIANDRHRARPVDALEGPPPMV
eukprot:COSAG06_NODE_33394_length_490_cov_1.437340_1_plen_105_part_10